MRPFGWLLSCSVMLAACSYDYDQFDSAGGGGGGSTGGSPSGGGSSAGGGSGSGGAAATGGTAGGGTGATGGSSGGGGSGGAPGGGGSSGSGGSSASGGATGGGGASGSGGGSGTGGCGANQKLCAANCVSVTDPATGCAGASCSACTLPNATAKCSGTGPSCDVDQCSAPFANCDSQGGNGCEQDLSKSDSKHCGSCANDCTTQGFASGFTCSSLVCRCTSFDQCKDPGSGTAACNGNGRCSCNGTECMPGEACKKTGPNQVCACNGGAACVPGLVCCKSPAGCRDLQTDSANCGACGKACPSGQSCSAGVCQP
ncbi:MAG: hypothetical protein U0263_22355 [Polyangiaceae bacterium]